jgi:hypothetical protein
MKNILLNQGHNTIQNNYDGAPTGAAQAAMYDQSARIALAPLRLYKATAAPFSRCTRRRSSGTRPAAAALVSTVSINYLR